MVSADLRRSQLSRGVGTMKIIEKLYDKIRNLRGASKMRTPANNYMRDIA